MLIAAFLAVGGFLGCDSNPGDDSTQNGGVDANGVDWTDYKTAGDFAIRIKNESNRDLVAFMNSLAKDNLLGGIPKNSGDFGLKKNTTLFNSNKDFSIIFLTKDDFITYKSNLASREQYPFTRIFAVYNASGTNEVPFIVSSRLGGNNKLVINNLTQLNMELRQDSPRGTTLGYAPYESNNTTLYMNQGSFYVYPVFKKYNAVRDEILTVYPRDKDGLPTGDEFSFENGNELTINATSYTGNVNLSSGAAFLVIKNSSNRGVTVQNGIIVQKTETGISTINSGDERTFKVLMDPVGNGKYENSKQISGWKIMNMGTRELAIAQTTLDADYRYTITVNGTWGENATIDTPQKGSQKITTEFTGN